MIQTTTQRSNHRYAFGKIGRGLCSLSPINRPLYKPQLLIPSSWVQPGQKSGARLGFVASNRRYATEFWPTMPGSLWNMFETPHPRQQ